MGIESTATGGLLDIRIVAEASQWFWLNPLPELDEVAIYQASQRQTPERDTAPVAPVTPTSNSSLSDSEIVPPAVQPQTDSPEAPASPPQSPTEDPEAPTTLAPQPTTTNDLARDSQASTTGNVAPTPPQSTGENIVPQANITLQSKPLLEARSIAPAPLALLEDATPEPGRAGNEGRLPIQPPMADVKLINDDATSFSEERLRAHRYDVKGKGANNAEEQLLRKRAYENTPEMKRLKAEQLRAYAGL
jgi:hypothetical protein